MQNLIARKISEFYNNKQQYRFIKKIIINKIKFIRQIYFNTKKAIIKRVLIEYPPYNIKMHDIFLNSPDPVRKVAISLAISKIIEEKIEGNFAELGVYRGELSKLIHNLAPERILYLFDTFEGFPEKFKEKPDNNRFKDTSLSFVKKSIGNLNNVIIRKGIFPNTAIGLEGEKFSFVLIDFDLYVSTLKALEFFYPKLSSGGYIVVHDYNNPRESNQGVFRAVNEFLRKKPEKIVELPDRGGSAMFRKI